MIGETWLSRETPPPKRVGNEGMERWGEFAELRMGSATQKSGRQKLLFQVPSTDIAW
jgi:hypothetical protein